MNNKKIILQILAIIVFLILLWSYVIQLRFIQDVSFIKNFNTKMYEIIDKGDVWYKEKLEDIKYFYNSHFNKEENNENKTDKNGNLYMSKKMFYTWKDIKVSDAEIDNYINVYKNLTYNNIINDLIGLPSDETKQKLYAITEEVLKQTSKKEIEEEYKIGHLFTYNQLTGFPNEAPPDGQFLVIISPINNIKYAYSNFNQEWELYVLDEVKIRSRAEAQRIINHMGEEITHTLSDE